MWGYCGILSLGHGAFFALGGYAMGMYLMRQIGERGVYGNPLLPDFMVFLNWPELPWYRPVLHSEQDVAPVAFCTVPASQLVHSVRPAESPYLPLEQSVQNEAAAPE